jgi:serine/threonine-protein kinase
MEYLEGQTLGRLLKKTIDLALPLGARLEIMCQMLDGLSYLHGFSDLDGTPLGLVHRDISPNNIFVTFEGSVKVLDFGVAKAAGISHVTEAGTFKGKLGYAAPEQIVGRSDQRSDVFAAGVLLWEILTYRRLTQDRTQTEIVQGRIAGAESELMLQKGSDVPAELMEICAKAAAKTPEDRYPTASAMQAAIRRYITEHSLEFPSEKLRDLLHRIFEADRTEMRRMIDQRMKQVQLEDEHPSQVIVAPTVPNAAAIFGATSSSGTGPTHAAPLGRGRLFVAAAFVALLAGGAGAFITRLRPAPEPSAYQAADGHPSSAGLAPAAPTAALVKLEISAEPASAEMILDGAKLETNPFSGQLPKDAALHRLEVRAPGRLSEARMVRLDQDLSLHVTLAVATAPAAGSAAAVGAKTSRRGDGVGGNSAPADDFVHKQRDTKGARPIDNSDPYGP